MQPFAMDRLTSLLAVELMRANLPMVVSGNRELWGRMWVGVGMFALRRSFGRMDSQVWAV